MQLLSFTPTVHALKKKLNSYECSLRFYALRGLFFLNIYDLKRNSGGQKERTLVHLKVLSLQINCTVIIYGFEGFFFWAHWISLESIISESRMKTLNAYFLAYKCQLNPKYTREFHKQSYWAGIQSVKLTHKSLQKHISHLSGLIVTCWNCSSSTAVETMQNQLFIVVPLLNQCRCSVEEPGASEVNWVPLEAIVVM